MQKNVGNLQRILKAGMRFEEKTYPAPVNFISVSRS